MKDYALTVEKLQDDYLEILIKYNELLKKQDDTIPKIQQLINDQRFLLSKIKKGELLWKKNIVSTLN